ncbi:hypothetical protein TNCV_2613901 [Trichonephila clavipes]|nr:hypothetical protein TNCV_2613901 [Trichonephila clavipes]
MRVMWLVSQNGGICSEKGFWVFKFRKMSRSHFFGYINSLIDVTLTASFFNWMMHHRTGRPTCGITSMNIFLTDELDESRTTTRHLPNDHPEVMT